MMFFETSPTSSATPPTSPESVAGSGSSAGDPSPRKLTYHHHHRDEEDPAAGTTKKAAAEKSTSWRFLPAKNPLRRWLAANEGNVVGADRYGSSASAAAKTIGISELRMMMPEQATVVTSGNVGVVAPSSRDVEIGRSEEDTGKAPSFAKDEMEEEKVVTASLIKDEAKVVRADGGAVKAPTSTKDEKEGLVRAANGDDASSATGVERRREDAALHSYFQKNLYWQRIRKQKQIVAAAGGGGGIFRSGRSEYYGTQPVDNEHSFAVVLSEMETEKKREEEEKEMKKKRREEEKEKEKEKEKKRQPAVSGTLLGFRALVIKLVREGESI
jgi:hypothetical protein